MGLYRLLGLISKYINAVDQAVLTNLSSICHIFPYETVTPELSRECFRVQ